MTKRLTMLALCALLPVFGLADNVTQTCASYLNMSNDDFLQALTAQASNIATALNQCQKTNVCQSLPQITECSALLANRAFMSTMITNLKNSGAKFNNNGMPANSAPVNNNNNTSAPSAAPAPTPATPSTTNGSTNNSNTNSNGNINWF